MLRNTSLLLRTTSNCRHATRSQVASLTKTNTSCRTIKTKSKNIKVSDKAQANSNTSKIRDPEYDKEFTINYTPYETIYKMPKYNNTNKNIPKMVSLTPGPPPPRSAIRRYTAPVIITLFLTASVYIYVNADDDVIQYWKDVDEGKVHPFDLMEERIEQQAKKLEEERAKRLGISVDEMNDDEEDDDDEEE